MKNSRFSNLPKIQPDALFQSFKNFKEAKSENKVNLSIGMLQDEEGKYIQFDCVNLADKELEKENLNKEYPNIVGAPDFIQTVKDMFFEKENIAYKEDRILVTQPITGGASLRIVSEIIKKFLPKKIHLSNLTFPPYLDLFSGLEICYYPYYNSELKSLDFENMVNYFENLEEKSIILFQLSSHNPTALDIPIEQWDSLTSLFKKKQFLTIFDAAYLGYATGSFSGDLYPIRKFSENFLEFFICYSSAKNFTNYCDDVGALFIVLNKKELLSKLKSHIVIFSRSFFSFPSLYGARIISKIVNNDGLRKLWLEEQKKVYDRIVEIRKMVVDEIQIQNVNINLEFLKKQTGIYMFLDLSLEQVNRLASENLIFLANGGRVNLTGLNKKNVNYFVNSLKGLFN